jgi:hypothetical protein
MQWYHATSLFDLDDLPFSFPCPGCQFENPATVRDVRLGARIICRGCKRPLHLGDQTGSFGKSRMAVNRAFESLAGALKINIKL